jgi:tripartite-type tricarboxylate transporter receptor subunit TctC
MNPRHSWLAFAPTLALAVLLHAPAAWAQAWPNKPVRFVVAFAPGGPADIIARLLGQKLGEALGQNIVVENRGGAGGSIASAFVAKADADGYTLLINTSAYAVNPAMQRNIPFDSEKDLTLAVLVASSPNIIVATPSLPAQNLKDLLIDAKSGKYNYGTAGAGTTPHLTAEYLFKVLGKVSITHIPFQGGGPALNAAMAGQVELTSVALPPAVELVKAGKVRGLAVTGSKRAAALPLVPTVAESGFPGFEDTTWVGVFAPARTPPEIIARINAEVNNILKNPEFQTRLANIGFDPMGGSSAEAAEFLKTELAKWARVVRETGAKAD